MNTATLINTTRRELARRVSGGVEVTLYWNADDDTTSVELYHPATGETVAFPVAPDQALDAFHHPYAYLDSSFPQADEPVAVEGSRQ
jgi:hypothetical protein